MDRKEKIIELAKQRGIIRPRDVEAAGIPREYLLRLYRNGELVRVGRGLYAMPETLTSESISLAEVSKRVPTAVICLISALQFHDLTTQITNRVWIAIENKKWKPVIEYPPIELVRLTGKAFNFGIEQHEVNRVQVKVYSPAKTVADCFKFRNKIGLDIALEALRETWKSRKASMDELWEAAKVCRVANVIRPYLEAIT
ncbi:MAG: type IV toxin-antitoxin system AbiEi family antitoxin domain-containing protein [Candidatus Euphemobacter frigidus]|nr:type IV toxin-antitoxin system AbiEi family antitoxin domain-containing protein [Candidatus Euphemobacter frigidus]MDP8275058.1 type IV toxin-antitoxin system AbiEi family antitoxin domain-containing protein [Candidatus Euphemobacter frigidus]